MGSGSRPWGTRLAPIRSALYLAAAQRVGSATETQVAGAGRDWILEGMFEMQRRWYAFFYLTTRLGLRIGEVNERPTREAPDA